MLTLPAKKYTAMHNATKRAKARACHDNVAEAAKKPFWVSPPGFEASTATRNLIAAAAGHTGT